MKFSEVEDLRWYIEVEQLWRAYPRSWNGSNKNFAKRMWYGFLELDAIYKKAKAVANVQ